MVIAWSEKNQGYARNLGSREIVGRIEILDKTGKFKIISSREGIVRNESFIKLIEKKERDSDDGYFYKTFKRLEKYVVDGLAWDSIPEEDRNNFSEIEKKIIAGETKQDDLEYHESEGLKAEDLWSNSFYHICKAWKCNRTLY